MLRTVSHSFTIMLQLLTVCGSPSPCIFLATDQSGTGNVRQSRDLAVTQTGINVLSLPSPRPRKQGGHDRIRCVQASRQIGHGNAYLDWFALPAARDMHQTHLGLNHDIVPGTVAVWPGLAISGDTGVDQLGIDGAQGLIIHVVFLEATREVVLDENVTFLGQSV